MAKRDRVPDFSRGPDFGRGEWKGERGGGGRGRERLRDPSVYPLDPTQFTCETVETRWSERSQVAQDKIGQTKRQETTDKVAAALGDAADAAQKLLGNG